MVHYVTINRPLLQTPLWFELIDNKVRIKFQQTPFAILNTHPFVKVNFLSTIENSNMPPSVFL